MDQASAAVAASVSRGVTRRRRWSNPWSSRSPLARREAREGYLYILPWIVGFLAFTALPMVATFVFSFANLTLAQKEPVRFVGLDNYVELVNDGTVRDALSVTFRFALLWLPFAIVVPFVLALALNSNRIRGAAIMRSLFFMPYVVPFVAGVLIWNQMFGVTGWIDGALQLLGVQDPPEWLFDSTFIYPALVIMGLWGIGAGIVINLAGLRGIPTELYEAATIDGAGPWGRLRNVTIPMMSPILFYTLILGVVEVLQYFLVPLVLKNGTGEPAGQTLFYNLYLYRTFFTYQQLSYGATLAWVLFFITLVIALALFALSRRWVYYAGER